MLMKISRWLLTLILLSVASSIAMADSTDPKMGLQGGCCSTGLFSLNDPNFSFTVLASDFTTIGQTELFDFINATGQTATEVDLLANLIQGTPALTFICDPSSEYFTQCSVTPEGGGQTLIRFFDPNTGEGGFGGIPTAPDIECDGVHSCSTETPGADFAVYVQDVNGDLVNLNQTTDGFTVQGTLLVPEPSTVLLVLGAGVLLLLFKRR
jgi:hypothetical protein